MKKRGRGIAFTIYPTSSMSGGLSAVYIAVREDGTVNLLSGAAELGQGIGTALAQIAAEELGVRIEDVTVYQADTERTPYDLGQIASRTCHIAGLAVISACQELKKIMFETAAERLGVDPAELEARDRKIYVRSCPEKFMAVSEVANLTHWDRRIMLIADGWHQPNISKGINPETGRGEPFAAFEYQATIADVEVDLETGLVDVLNLYCAVDCGRAINPLIVEGQIEGGMSMAMGYGCMENLHPYYPEVDGLSPDYNVYFMPNNLHDYLIPTAMDMPFLTEAIVDNPDPNGPYGATGVGEFTMNAAGTAIANAIYDATGVRIWSGPATPEKILAGLNELKQDE